MRRRRLPVGAAEALMWLLFVALLIPAGVVGWAIGHQSSRSAAARTTSAGKTVAVPPQVAAGGHVFVQFACSRCHGPQGQGGVSPYVPALSKLKQQLTPVQLRKIIDHGLGESTNPTRPYMPVWGAVISTQQVGQLVSYIRAGLPQVSTATPPEVPSDQGAAVAGSVLYVRDGCINCHGPNGLGGVPNPQAPDKTIPALAGQAFRKQFNTDAKIVAVIRSGSVIGGASIVSMPHWGGIIPAAELQALVAYTKTLK